MTFSHTCSVFNALQLTGMVRRKSNNLHIDSQTCYQKYIVLTFDSFFIVYMLTYVLTKFNTALGQ